MRKAVGNSGRGMSLKVLENWLMTVRMTELPCDMGRSIRKSMAM